MEAALQDFSLSLDEPLVTADGTVERRGGWLVRVEAAGEVGIGEATPLSGWTESQGACRAALAGAAETLEAHGPEPALGSLAGAPAARHGLQLALADLAARIAGVPLYRHLGGDEAVERVPVNATVGEGSARETAAAAGRAADEGFDCVKVKVGTRSAFEDADRLRAVREAVGEDVELRADANAAWTRAQAYEAVRNYPTADVAVIEQPLAPTDLHGHATLRGHGIDIAVDETVVHTGLEAALDADAADLVVLKPMALGGLDRAREAARTARARGVDVVVSNTVDGVVARTAAGHLAASLPEVRACGLATADRLAEDLGPDPAPVEDGEMLVPQGPGHGVEGVWR